jgi:predicted TPR repeat methyltransferase
MVAQKTRDFDTSAASWDEEPRRLKLAADVAAAIMREVPLSPEMDVLDFGCGTGLVTLQLQPHVRSITGADSSQGMLKVLEEKISAGNLNNAGTQFLDPTSGKGIEGRFHLIVSSMTMHHVAELAPLFREFHAILLPGGKLCIADLDAEGGRFHSDNTGVMHFGFDREQVTALLTAAGFSRITVSTAATVHKPAAGMQPEAFSVFLATATK